jgi:hypothetical protein
MEQTEKTSKEKAEEMVVKYVKDRRTDKEGNLVARTIKQVRSHFDTTKLHRIAAGLDCDWQEVIDQLIADSRLQVTNGFVWVRDSSVPKWGQMPLA